MQMTPAKLRDRRQICWSASSRCWFIPASSQQAFNLFFARPASRLDDRRRCCFWSSPETEPQKPSAPNDGVNVIFSSHCRCSEWRFWFSQRNIPAVSVLVICVIVTRPVQRRTTAQPRNMTGNARQWPQHPPPPAISSVTWKIFASRHYLHGVKRCHLLHCSVVLQFVVVQLETASCLL